MTRKASTDNVIMGYIGIIFLATRNVSNGYMMQAMGLQMEGHHSKDSMFPSTARFT
jgi:hypothetical protein